MPSLKYPNAWCPLFDVESHAGDIIYLETDWVDGYYGNKRHRVRRRKELDHDKDDFYAGLLSGVNLMDRYRNKFWRVGLNYPSDLPSPQPNSQLWAGDAYEHDFLGSPNWFVSPFNEGEHVFLQLIASSSDSYDRQFGYVLEKADWPNEIWWLSFVVPAGCNNLVINVAGKYMKNMVRLRGCPSYFLFDESLL